MDPQKPKKISQEDERYRLKTKIILLSTKFGAYIINTILASVIMGVVGFGLYALYIALTKA